MVFDQLLALPVALQAALLFDQHPFVADLGGVG